MTSFFFAGNKIDRDDVEIPTEVGDEFAQRHGMYFLETSAKASDNVERLFTEIAQDLLQVSTYLKVTQNSGYIGRTRGYVILRLLGLRKSNFGYPAAIICPTKGIFF